MGPELRLRSQTRRELTETAGISTRPPTLIDVGICRHFAARSRSSRSRLKIVVSPVRIRVSPCHDPAANRRFSSVRGGVARCRSWMVFRLRGPIVAQTPPLGRQGVPRPARVPCARAGRSWSRGCDLHAAPAAHRHRGHLGVGVPDLAHDPPHVEVVRACGVVERPARHSSSMCSMTASTRSGLVCTSRMPGSVFESRIRNRAPSRWCRRSWPMLCRIARRRALPFILARRVIQKRTGPRVISHPPAGKPASAPSYTASWAGAVSRDTSPGGLDDELIQHSLLEHLKSRRPAPAVLVFTRNEPLVYRTMSAAAGATCLARDVGPGWPYEGGATRGVLRCVADGYTHRKIESDSFPVRRVRHLRGFATYVNIYWDVFAGMDFHLRLGRTVLL